MPSEADKEKALPFFLKAQKLYENSIASGNDHYLHHLSGFYVDSVPNAKLAVNFALSDLSLRQGLTPMTPWPGRSSKEAEQKRP